MNQFVSSEQKETASAWFEDLRNQICDAFENLENSLSDGPHKDQPAGRFERKKTFRKGEEGEDAGGGEMSVMRGRVFEKVGVNISTVYGKLSPQAIKAMTARKDMPELENDPRFWAAGISLVSHMQNPRVPAVHMNTRMFWTPFGYWFGGGGDLNPPIPYEEDTELFHAAYKAACDHHNPEYYPKFKAWADEYFLIKHWNMPRGVGGIFYDDLNSGNWDNDFEFTKDVGKAFLKGYLPLVEKRLHEPFSEDDRETQLIYRGKYAEFNLVYDRGTHFGLATGHNPEAVLMSLPPVAKWP